MQPFEAAPLMPFFDSPHWHAPPSQDDRWPCSRQHVTLILPLTHPWELHCNMQSFPGQHALEGIHII